MKFLYPHCLLQHKKAYISSRYISFFYSISNAIEVCRAELFTKEVELRERYPQALVDKALRVREMYNWFIANSDGTDRELVAEGCQRHDIHRTTAYSDLAVVKSLLPMLGSTSRDFHRWRTNEMLIATYKMAEKRKDSKTMERAATAYGRLNRVDLEDEQAICKFSSSGCACGF